MALATSSLPVPLSPTISTLASEVATAHELEDGAAIKAAALP